MSRPARGTCAHRGARRGGTAARTSRLIGAILAGGANARFGGEPKGLRTVGGVRIVDRVAHALRATTDELVLVSNAPDARTWLPGTRVLADSRAERGSLVGLHTALVHAPNGALVVAWDMPFLSRELLSMVRDAGTTGTAGTIAAAVPDGPRGAEPFCAFYAARCLPVIEVALDEGDLRLSAFIERLAAVERVSRVNVSACGDPERLFFNVNSAADLAVAESMERRDRSILHGA